MLTITYCN